MKTQIVYVVTSSNDDIYMEQAFVSAWSCRHYTPDCKIILVCDQDTAITMEQGTRRKYSDLLFDQIVVSNFDASQSMKERSRWLKTSLREIIEGDFLYIDTDTIICKNLSFVDDYTFELGFVQDLHSPMDTRPATDTVIDRIYSLYGFDYSSEPQFFNSGVSYVKDTVRTHQFYARWHELWKENCHKENGMFDQGSLNVANAQLGHLITVMSGDMNCQIMMSIQYLHTAAIVHFFSLLTKDAKDSKRIMNPFLGKEIYLRVKDEGLSPEIQDLVLNCKSAFVSPSVVVAYEGLQLWYDYLRKDCLMKTNTYYFLSYLMQVHPRIFRILENLFCNLRKLKS